MVLKKKILVVFFETAIPWEKFKINFSGF